MLVKQHIMVMHANVILFHGMDSTNLELIGEEKSFVTK